jgi:hypothetical protein
VTVPVSEVLAITLPTDAEEYISLYSTDGTAFTFISRMHPKLRVPEFVRYRLPGFVAGETYRVLAGERAVRSAESRPPRAVPGGLYAPPCRVQRIRPLHPAGVRQSRPDR